MKKALKIISFFVCLIMLYLYIGYVLLPKELKDMGGEKYFSATSFKDEPKNTIDVMFYGNSDVYSGISPMEIYEETGIRSFGCGMAKQTMSAIYSQVKQTLKTQKPKVIAIDTDCFYQPNSAFGGSKIYDYSLLISPFFYHSRWKELTWKDFVSAPNLKGKDNYSKGFYYSNDVNEYKLKENYMQNTDAQPKKLKKTIEQDFNKIYKLCKKKNIEILLITIPTPITWSNAKSNGIQKLCNKYNSKNSNYQIKFYDMNLGLDGFDYSTHFRDDGNHCNFEGAKVVSKAVGKYLKTNYQLTDHSNNAKWQKSLAKYRKNFGY